MSPLLRRVPESGWATLSFLALYILVSWPVVLSPAHTLVCDEADGYFDMLLFWYARKGLLLSPHVDSLFFPDGVALGPEKAYWLVPLLSVPLQWMMPLPAVFNLICAVFFVATASSVFLLSRDLGGSRGGSVLAGALFVLSPAYLNELSHGIPENLCMQWPTLVVLFGRRAGRTGASRDAACTALFFALSWLTSWYIGGIATLLLLFVPLRPLVGPVSMAALGVAVTMIFASTSNTITAGRWDGASAQTLIAQSVGAPSTTSEAPPPQQGSGAIRFVNAVHGLQPRGYAAWGARQVITNSCDPGGLLSRFRPNRLRDVLPGLVLLGLAGLGAWREPRRCLPLLAVAGLFGILSFGPVLSFRGQLVCPMPLEIFYRLLPLLARLRPARFMLAACLALSLMSAQGFPRLRSRATAAVVLVTLVILAWVEVARVHVAHYNVQPTRVRVPQTYVALSQPTTGAIIDLPLIPFDLAAGQHAWLQTVHGQPMLNYDFTSVESLGRLGAMARDNTMVACLLGLPAQVRRDDVQRLAAQGFGTLIVHTQVAAKRQLNADPLLYDAAWLDTIERIYGPPRATPDAMLLFDMRSLREDAWDAQGRLRRGRFTWVPAQDSQPSHVARGERRVLSALAPTGAHLALQGWIRGETARLRVTQGRRELAVFNAAGESWQWVQLPLAPLTSSSPMRVTLETSADGDPSGCDARDLSLRRETVQEGAPAR